MAKTYKACGCGRCFSAVEWYSLPVLGVEFCGTPLDMRNCPSCDSTLAMEILSERAVETFVEMGM